MNIHRSSRLASLNQGVFRRLTLSICDNQKQNHYDTLGITSKATQGDVKTAYYKLSKEYHPDLNKGDEAAADKFRNITTAYEVLGNVKSRKVYDRGLLVGGSFEHEYKTEGDTVVENYPHAPFYHHRNKPSHRKTQSGTVNYNIDEWTQAHYSKTFYNNYKKKTDAEKFKVSTRDDQNDISRAWPVLSLIIIITFSFLTYRTDAGQNFDNSSKVTDKPD